MHRMRSRPSNSHVGCLRCLRGNQTILVWSDVQGNAPSPRAYQTRMVWLPWSMQPFWHGISFKIRIAGYRPAFLMALFLFAAWLSAGCESREPVSAPLPENSKGDRAAPLVEAQENTAGVSYAETVGKRESVRKPARRYRLGAVLTYLGNPYCQRLADGMHEKAVELGLFIDIQAGLTESDHEGQRAIMEGMIGKGYDALLVSPQTDINLDGPALMAKEKGVLLINVDAALLRQADLIVAPDHYRSGVLAGRLFLDRIARGAKVAVLNGLVEDSAAEQRNRGLEETLKEASVEIVGRSYCFWDLQVALENATRVLKDQPDLAGFFSNSDIMALGAAQAVKRANLSGRVAVVGRGGIDLVRDAVRAGVMTATIDTFPHELGQASVELAVRALQGESLPRVVFTRQEAFTKSAITRPGPPHPPEADTEEDERRAGPDEERRIHG